MNQRISSLVQSILWKLFIVITAVVLIASIVGATIAFGKPTKIENPAPVLNYTHVGEFDYIAQVKAAYLYDDITLEDAIAATQSTEPTRPPQENPKYPADIIDRFDMTFSYELAPDEPVVNISEQVEVKAYLEKPDGTREELVLVPTTAQVGNFTISFSLDVAKLASSPTTIIQANVYPTVETHTDYMFASFTQSLTIWSKGPLLEVLRNFTSTQQASFGELVYEQRGSFDYAIQLKSDSPFGAVILRPPPEPTSDTTINTTPLSAQTLGPGETIYTKLFDGMDVTFSYNFEPDGPVVQIAEEVEINAILENPGVWSKTFSLVPLTRGNGAFSVTFHLSPDDFSHFLDVYKAIATETGVSAPYSLIIKADVHTYAETDLGPINEVFSQALSTTLGALTIDWKGNLQSSQPGVIEGNQTTTSSTNHMGFTVLSVSSARKLFTITGVVSFIAFLSLLVLYVQFKREPLSIFEKEALRARKKHKNVIVDVDTLPEAKTEDKVILIGSLDELVKVADALLKPVLHKAEATTHVYCVIDASLRFEYVSSLAKLAK